MSFRKFLGWTALAGLALVGCRHRPDMVNEVRVVPPPPLAVPGGGNGSVPEVPDPGNGTDLGNGKAPSDGSEWQSVSEPLAPKPEDMAKVITERRWEAVYFAYNQSFVGAGEEGKLNALSDYLQKHPDYNVLVEGHCDNRGSEEYNRALGERRALAVKEYMVAHKVAADRIQTISYGEERPAAKGNTEKAHSLNRRAEFVIYVPKKP